MISPFRPQDAQHRKPLTSTRGRGSRPRSRGTAASGPARNSPPVGQTGIWYRYLRPCEQTNISRWRAAIRFSNWPPPVIQYPAGSWTPSAMLACASATSEAMSRQCTLAVTTTPRLPFSRPMTTTRRRGSPLDASGQRWCSSGCGRRPAGLGRGVLKAGRKAKETMMSRPGVRATPGGRDVVVATSVATNCKCRGLVAELGIERATPQDLRRTCQT